MIFIILNIIFFFIKFLLLHTFLLEVHLYVKFSLPIYFFLGSIRTWADIEMILNFAMFFDWPLCFWQRWIKLFMYGLGSIVDKRNNGIVIPPLYSRNTYYIYIYMLQHIHIYVTWHIWIRLFSNYIFIFIAQILARRNNQLKLITLRLKVASYKAMQLYQMC